MRHPFVANCSMLYAGVPLPDRASAAAADGYRTVEFWWPFESTVPHDAEVARFVESVRTAGVHVVALNFTLGGTEAGGRGILSHPGRTAELAAHLDVVATMVQQLGIRWCNVPYGLRVDSAEPDEQDATAVANLRLASDRLLPLGAVPMLEPLSGADGYPITTAAQAVAVIERVDELAGRHGAVGLLADLYHLAANGEDIAAVLREHIDRIVHVQIADFPGRHEPGTGALRIDDHLALLDRLGYRGAVALEYIPSV